MRRSNACPNASASLFTSAKIAHLALLPQGQPERYARVVNMVETMESFFGSCTNHGECEAACPKGISIDFIALMHKDYRTAKFKNRKELDFSDFGLIAVGSYSGIVQHARWETFDYDCAMDDLKLTPHLCGVEEIVKEALVEYSVIKDLN